MVSYTPQTSAGYGSSPQLGYSSGGYNGGGSGGAPNFLGGGMYTGAPINVNQNAFNNAVGAQAGQQLSGQLNSYLPNTTGGVSAATAGGGINPAYTSGINGLNTLAGQYATMAAGGGPSLATVTANTQGAQNLASQESLLGSARGSGNPAQAQLIASNNLNDTGNSIAQNAVAGRTAEELGAMNALGGVQNNIVNAGLGQQGLNQQIGMFNAGQQNQIGLANQSNNTAANTAYLQALSAINNQQQQGQIAGQQLAANTQLGQENLQNTAYNNSANQNSKIFGSLMSGAGSIAGAFL